MSESDLPQRPVKQKSSPSRPSQDVDNFDESYWKTHLPKRPYYQEAVGFDRYEAALKYGVSARQQHQGTPFDQVEKELAAGWQQAGKDSGLSWDQVRGAVEDAWQGGQMGDAIANQGGFTEPPTFGDSGSLTPRGRDEPNQ